MGCADVSTTRPFVGPRDVAQAKEQFEYHQEELETTTERLSGTHAHLTPLQAWAAAAHHARTHRLARENDDADLGGQGTGCPSSEPFVWPHHLCLNPPPLSSMIATDRTTGST